MNKLLIVGTVAFDAIETPFGKTDKILGGAATYIGLSASFFNLQSAIVSGQLDGNPVISSTSIGDYSVAYNNSGFSSQSTGMLGVSAARVLLQSEKSILDKYRQVGL